MSVIPGSDDTLSADPITIGSMPSFYSNPAAATATLRRIAGRNLNFGSAMEHGSIEEYRNLSAGDQVALNDEMERLVTAYPASFPTPVVKSAQDHINNPYYGTPLADTSYFANLDAAISGAKEGAKDYATLLIEIAAVAAVVYLAGKYIGRPTTQSSPI